MLLDLIHIGIGIGVGTLDWERENPLQPPQKRIFSSPTVTELSGEIKLGEMFRFRYSCFRFI
jgi:hypothetical protein